MTGRVEVALEGWVQIDKVDCFIPNVPSQYTEIAPIIQHVLSCPFWHLPQERNGDVPYELTATVRLHDRLIGSGAKVDHIPGKEERGNQYFPGNKNRKLSSSRNTSERPLELLLDRLTYRSMRRHMRNPL